RSGTDEPASALAACRLRTLLAASRFLIGKTRPDSNGLRMTVVTRTGIQPTVEAVGSIARQSLWTRTVYISTGGTVARVSRTDHLRPCWIHRSAAKVHVSENQTTCAT